ncbi:MAG TPA: TRAP transporter substrate-binding protein DctP [Syntrophorhabdaceae bacterium]|nr:TRAP transporter substrate-binding protein DctP [Syntrophorhabdaceae bacterium]
MKKIIVLLMTAFVFMVLTVQSHAQQKVIELTYGTPFPADHTYSKADQKWIAKIEKETNGRVKIKPYWGGQIIGGQNQVEEIAAGAADIGYIVPTNSKTGFTICKAMSLYLAGASDKVGARVFKELRAKFPEIEKEYTDAGVQVLEWQSPGIQLITRKPVRRLSDFKGLRMKSLGDWNKVLKELGGEGIEMSNAEVYVSLQKGILDAVLSPLDTLEALKFADVAKFVSMISVAGPPFAQRAMNLSKWKSLPPDIQKVFENNVEYWEQQVNESLQAAIIHATEFGKKSGVEFINMSDADKSSLTALMVSTAEKDAKALDTKGIRATQILHEAQRLIKQYSK